MNKSQSFIVEPADLNKPVTVLQKYIRGGQARFKYAINTLPTHQLTNESFYVLGNDPVIKGLETYRTNEQMALIGTGGFRSILIACQLNANSKLTPKLIIIDNSQKVYNYWQMAKSDFTRFKSTKEYLNYIDNYAKTHANSAKNILEFRNFMLELFNKFSYQRIAKIIQSTVVLRQGWENENIHIKIKNILTKIGIKDIYMYASNIVSHCKAESEIVSDKVLANIALMNPKVCIHTDTLYYFTVDTEIAVDGKPENYFLVTDHRPQAVKTLLFSKVASDKDRVIQDAQQRFLGNLGTFRSKKYTASLSAQTTLFAKSSENDPENNKIVDRIFETYQLDKSLNRKSQLEKALRNAAFKDNAQDIRDLVTKLKVDINARDDNKDKRKTALHHAVEQQHTASIKVLLDLKAKVDISDASGTSALTRAEQIGGEVFSLLSAASLKMK